MVGFKQPGGGYSGVWPTASSVLFPRSKSTVFLKTACHVHRHLPSVLMSTRVFQGQKDSSYS